MYKVKQVSCAVTSETAIQGERYLINEVFAAAHNVAYGTAVRRRLESHLCKLWRTAQGFIHCLAWLENVNK